MIEAARSISSSETVNGRAILHTLPATTWMRRPRSRQAAATLDAISGAGSLLARSATNSTPISRPRPRTSPIVSELSISPLSVMAKVIMTEPLDLVAYRRRIRAEHRPPRIRCSCHHRACRSGSRRWPPATPRDPWCAPTTDPSGPGNGHALDPGCLPPAIA